MPSRAEAAENRMFSPALVAVVAACIIIVAATVGAALWSNGAFLPRWVQWNTTTLKVDTNGNKEIENVILSNRHLTIIDSEENHYVTPNDWLVSDVNIGDMVGDGTPEVVALLWAKENDGGTYRLPVAGFLPGFSQYIYVFNYADGAIQPIWHSSPLDFDAVDIGSEAARELDVMLADGTMTRWEWNDPGLILDDADNSAYVIVD